MAKDVPDATLIFSSVLITPILVFQGLKHPVCTCNLIMDHVEYVLSIFYAVHTRKRSQMVMDTGRENLRENIKSVELILRTPRPNRQEILLAQIKLY